MVLAGGGAPSCGGTARDGAALRCRHAASPGQPPPHRTAASRTRRRCRHCTGTALNYSPSDTADSPHRLDIVARLPAHLGMFVLGFLDKADLTEAANVSLTWKACVASAT